MSEIDRLKRIIAEKDRLLHEKNLELDAMHYIWCSGGCIDGAHRWDGGELTRETLARARRAVHRMGLWLDNRETKRLRHEEVSNLSREDE